ncbi:hypothetical protein [Pedobacter glucosidilyticus]|uniref:hypothetical protein n=1 Tax=Pedobacter glucosidilyticus TaxID=1122941 RepID=UPI0026F1BE0F|nr:hypothetical protein [Pedobacter glucosidilyticus]
MKFYSILTVLFLVFSGIQAQVKPETIQSYELELQKLGEVMINDSLEQNRIQANYKFVRTLISALKEKNAFAYPFDSLSRYITVKTADDKKFKIFTWFLTLDDGSFRYYGAIQLNNPNQLELIPLTDYTSQILDNSLILSNKQWYGAVYYQIIPVLGIKDPYYILLGWKGKSLTTSSKVIEILSFSGKDAVFGKPVLQDDAKSKLFLNRKVFEYSSSVSMLLRYDKDDKLIVLDHLAVPNEEMAGIPSMYGPDLSYDAYRFKNGKWQLQENVKLQNKPDISDELFIDPTKLAPPVNQQK